MNSKLAIKICGMTEHEIAYSTALLGADYIGLVFHPKSKRLVSTERAKAISRAVEHTDCQAVGVFVDHGHSTIAEIAKAVNLNFVQLHGTRSKREHSLLPRHIRKIYVIAIDESGYAINHNETVLNTLDPKKDFILFDSATPGTGTRIKTDHLQNIAKDFSYFIAGGIHIDNVSTTINHIQPYGVDLSSSLEIEPGVKDIRKIRDFILHAHHKEQAHVLR